MEIDAVFRDGAFAVDRSREGVSPRTALNILPKRRFALERGSVAQIRNIVITYAGIYTTSTVFIMFWNARTMYTCNLVFLEMTHTNKYSPLFENQPAHALT